MRWLVVLLLSGGCETVFPLDFNPPSFDPAACPAELEGKTHRYFEESFDWVTAQIRCVELDDNPDDMTFTHLVVMSSFSEVGEFTLPTGAHAYVGYTNARLHTTPKGTTANPAEFEWITLEETGPVEWAGNDPDSTSGDPVFAKIEDGSFGLHDSSGDGLSNDGTPVGYVCECDGFPVQADRLP